MRTGILASVVVLLAALVGGFTAPAVARSRAAPAGDPGPGHAHVDRQRPAARAARRRPDAALVTRPERRRIVRAADVPRARRLDGRGRARPRRHLRRSGTSSSPKACACRRRCSPTELPATLQHALATDGVIRATTCRPATAAACGAESRSVLATALARPRPRRRSRLDRAQQTRRLHRGGREPDRRAGLLARPRGRQRALVLAPAHARRRSRTGPHRPRPPRQRRAVARVRRLRARPARGRPRRRSRAQGAPGRGPGRRRRTTRNALPAPGDRQREPGPRRRRP